jgi:predicted amidohydrolase YtcJ
VLERIGVFDGSAVVPTGGVVVRDESGDPTGTLEEQAQNLARALLVPYATDDTARAIGSDVFAEMQRAHPRPDARPRIEHAAVTTPEQIAQMAEVGVTPVPQARFLYEIGDTMAAAIGPDRAAGLYRHASFLRAGLRVPGSSDRPVAAGAPLLGMQSMVERRSSSGAVLGPDERVDATTALRAYTLDAAWIAGEEQERGSLTPGKLADFVLLTDDVTAVLQDRIGETGVIATFVGGRCTHGAGELGLEQEG